MTPEESLDLIDQAIATIPANRETHDRLKQAIKIIAKAIMDAKDPGVTIN